MRNIFKINRSKLNLSILALILLFSAFLYFNQRHVSAATTNPVRLITIYDREHETSIISRAGTVKEALNDAKITLDDNDVVEPARDETLVASSYRINIYRARPVVVVDGSTRLKIMTPYQTPKQIAKSAGITVYPEDITDLRLTTNMLSDGAGLEMVIERATVIYVNLYGKDLTLRTQASTVKDFLKEKNIVLSADDKLSVSDNTKIEEFMNFKLWREGKHTISEEEPIDFEVETIYDADRPTGYRVIRTPGVLGKQNVTYEVEVVNGKEISRKKIAGVVLVPASKQVEVIGVKSNGGLTKAMGVNFFVDSNGVTHRETYYDLLMNIVTRNCGGGGAYSVREDGVKVDKDGFILIAANLDRYPRCSVVQTSLGLAKVYDTGGFALKHPDGFDIAADWTNYDGR